MSDSYKMLKNEVMEILESMAVDSSLEIVIEEVLQHGCVSGIVPHLIYYHQTEKFFDRHRKAINDLAQEVSEEIYGDPHEIYYNLNFGSNKNSLAWFGFEEMTAIISSELNI